MCSDLTSSVAGGGYKKSDTPTHELIQQEGGKAVFQSTDVSSEDGVKKLVGAAVKNYERVDM